MRLYSISVRATWGKLKQIHIMRILIFIVGVICVYRITTFMLVKTYSFLALTRPVEAEVLVVEGWLRDYMLDEAVDEIRSGNYSYILTTGFKNEIMNTAEKCKEKIIMRGVDSSCVYAVAAPAVDNEHTLATAMEIRKWLGNKRINNVNIFTGGPHGRKSLVIFQKVLGKSVNVGVISSQIRHYPPEYWWTSIRGIKVTMKYLIGYVYSLSLKYVSDK